MDSDLKRQIQCLAVQYEVEAFAAADPVQFPRRFTAKADIEIAAVISQWIAYGNRRAIIATLDELFDEIAEPLAYIRSDKWAKYAGDERSLYRFYQWKDFYALCTKLRDIYSRAESMEALIDPEADYACQVYALFEGVNGFPDPSKGSACKRIHMMLRWLVRQGSAVDLGVWRRLDARRLVVPVDVHVHRQAMELGLTKRKQADARTAREITDALREAFPSDPARGDFALFGLGIEKASK